MSPTSLELHTIVTWVDLKDRIGIRPLVYYMRYLCFSTQLYFLPDETNLDIPLIDCS